MERFAGDAERGPDATGQVLGVVPAVTPDVEQPFPELVRNSMVELTGGKVPSQMNDGLRTGPHERAATWELSPGGESNAALTQQSHRKPNWSDCARRIHPGALVDLSDG
jgi:hypothetical protein